MLENLVESRTGATRKTNGRAFLAGTGALVLSFCAGLLLWSMFAKDIAMAGGNLDIAGLVAPVEIAPDAPPPIVEIERKTTRNPKIAAAAPALVVPERSIGAQMRDSQEIPDGISTVKNTRSFGNSKTTKIVQDMPGDQNESNCRRNCAAADTSAPTVFTRKTDVEDDTGSEKRTPPPVKKTPPAQPGKESPPIKLSGGVLNGEATSLPKPVYSASAKTVGAVGTVTVQITIDEKGNVVSAKATEGHILLRKEAEAAARRARFKPTKLSNVPVKVTGTIVYKFS
jgi:TonB family protein